MASLQVHTTGSALSDVILRRVLLSGDVELNPGPALGEFIT